MDSMICSQHCLLRMQLLLFVITSIAQGEFISPQQHTFPTGLEAVSGSNANGGCPTQCVIMNSGVWTCQCSNGIPTNSTLIDGVCPTSVDITNPEFARDFFTVSRNGDDSVLIGFRWANSFVLRGVELKLFNCETLFIGIRTINIWRSIIYPSFNSLTTTLVGSYILNVNDLSCNDVIVIVISTDSTSGRNYFIEFAFPVGDSNTGVYVAEARFSDSIITIPEIVSSSLPPQVSSTPMQSTPALFSTTAPISTAGNSLITGQFTSSSLNLISTSQSIRSTATMSDTIFTTSGLPSGPTSELILPLTTPTISPTPSRRHPTELPTEDTPITTPPPVVPSQPFDSLIGPIVGSLAAVIIILLVIIIIGVCLVCFFLKNKIHKSNVRHLQQKPNDPFQDMNPRYSYANNQYYEDTVHKQGGTMTTDGQYFEVDFTTSAEPIYQTVYDKKIDDDVTCSKKDAKEEDSYYDTINEEPIDKMLLSCSKVKVGASLKSMEELELCQDVKMEAEMKSRSTNSLKITGVIFDNKKSEIETIENVGDCAYETLANSASVHSCLSSFTKPGLISMAPNPTYESHDSAVEAVQDPGLSDEMYAYPDAIDEDSNPKDTMYTDILTPHKPPLPHNSSLTEADADLYANVEKEAQPNEASLKSTVSEDVYTDLNLSAINTDTEVDLIYSLADSPPTAESTPIHEQTSLALNVEEIYDLPAGDNH